MTAFVLFATGTFILMAALALFVGICIVWADSR